MDTSSDKFRGKRKFHASNLMSWFYHDIRYTPLNQASSDLWEYALMSSYFNSRSEFNVGSFCMKLFQFTRLRHFSLIL